MYDRLRIIQKNERIRTLITDNLVPRAFPSENGRGKKDLGTSLAWKQILTKKLLIPSSYLSLLCMRRGFRWVFQQK